MSAGLHVERNAKTQDVNPHIPLQFRISDQTWNPELEGIHVHGIPEPSVDSERRQGGLLRVGNGQHQGLRSPSGEVESIETPTPEELT
jgi:hypothetical protein